MPDALLELVGPTHKQLHHDIAYDLVHRLLAPENSCHLLTESILNARHIQIVLVADPNRCVYLPCLVISCTLLYMNVECLEEIADSMLYPVIQQEFDWEPQGLEVVELE